MSVSAWYVSMARIRQLKPERLSPMKLGLNHRAWMRSLAPRMPSMVRRWAAWLDLMFVDHGVFRAIYANRHKIDDDMYRSSQPSPGQVAKLARHGIKTIINLRGPRDCGSYNLEVDACVKRGITLVDFQVQSRDAPEKTVLYGARDLFRSIEYPALMHCKSGADRAGLMAVLYLFVHKGQPLEEAMNQLSLRYGHIKQAKTGLLDYIFEAYAAYAKEYEVDFFEWVDTVYDRDALKSGFKSGVLASAFVDGILRRE